MIGEAARRIVVGLLLGMALAVLAVLMPLILLVGRRTYAGEAGSATSCMLNAITGGPRTVTYSAWSWQRYIEGKRDGALRVWAVDRINFMPGHCSMAWDSHRGRGLI